MTDTQPTAPQNDEPPIKWRMRSLNKLDYLVLGFMCLITIGIALYDLTKLADIREESLNKCNDHWVSEFKEKCAGPWQEENLTKTLVYSYPTPGTSSPPENP